ncbi:MAG TPA: prepilin-type N-terminal cleavage/methylation domain-containing protein [Gemmatimonadales bacterium]|nr:prepilin-type N-terminal cleavage/methylation domain-containing protein [Gemmatimonadales bacterium]
MKQGRCGFTLVEVMVAIAVLAIGIMALAGSSSSVTRMIGHGKVETRAAQVAARRMDILRLAAKAPPRCTNSEFVSGGPAMSSGVSESWTVPGAGKVRHVRVTVTYLTVRGPRTAMLESRIAC